MFEKFLLSKEGEIPELFRQQEKVTDSNSDLDGLMKKINKEMSGTAEDEVAVVDSRGMTPARMSLQKVKDEGVSLGSQDYPFSTNLRKSHHLNKSLEDEIRASQNN